MEANNIVRSGGATIWSQIEDILAREILAGELKGRLANEDGLATRFGVNRHTIRQAIKALSERGLIEVAHGRGTFVREDVIDYELGLRTRFAHSLAKARKLGASRILGDHLTTADETVASMLEVPAGTPVLRIDSLDVVEEKVVGVCTQYFPCPRFASFSEHYREFGKTHLALAACGVHEFTRKLSRVTARLPEREVARQLKQATSNPILCVESVYQDNADIPIEYGISLFSSTSVQLLIEP